MKHALISMYSMLLKVYWKLHNGPVTLSTSNKYRALDASTFTLHGGSDVPWTSRSSRAWRGSTQHLLPVVKMTQHRGYFCQESERWRLVAGDWWWLLPARLCRIPYPKYMRNPSREMRWWEGNVGALLTYSCLVDSLWCLIQCGEK